MKDLSITIPGVKKNLSQNEQIISLISGSMLLMKVLSGKKKPVSGLTAGYMIFRGATGFCPIYRALDIDHTQPTGDITVHTSVTVNRPRNEVYAYWRNLSNLPLFMKHLESVVELDEKHSEWTIKLPANLASISWKSEIVSEINNEYIFWQSLPDSQIENSGVVRFVRLDDSRTEVQVEISYRAPLGAAGEIVGKLLKPDLELAIKNEILGFKEHMEEGGVVVQ